MCNIGAGANVSTGAATNRIAIGYNASATADNSTVITNIYNTTVSSPAVATVNSSNQLSSLPLTSFQGEYIYYTTLLSATISGGASPTTLVSGTLTMPSYGTGWRLLFTYFIAINGSGSGNDTVQSYVNYNGGNLACCTILTNNNGSYGLSGNGISYGSYAPGASVGFGLLVYAASYNISVRTGFYYNNSILQIQAIMPN
jgi:hypothetical protein